MLSKSHKIHLILIGNCGVGKSTIGKLLASKLNLSFYDSDEEIIKETKKSIINIFKFHGESYFRNLEKRKINFLCKKKKTILISTGAGAILLKENRKLMSQYGFCIFLKASAKFIYKRIFKDIYDKNIERPSLNKENLKIEIKNITKQRDPLYLKIADFQIDVELNTLDEIFHLLLSFKDLHGSDFLKNI